MHPLHLPSHFTRLVARMIWRAFFFLLISLSLGLLSLRLLFPLLAEHPLWLQNRLSHALGQDIRIGQVETAWNGWLPHLRLARCQVFEPGGARPIAEFAAAEVQADVIASLLAGRLLTEHIRLSGLRLRLRHDADGRLRLALPAEQVGKRGFIAWLLQQPSLLLDDLEVSLQGPAGRVVHFERLRFSVQRDGAAHRFHALLHFPEETYALRLPDQSRVGLRGGSLEIRGSSLWQAAELSELTATFSLRQTTAVLLPHSLEIPRLDGRVGLSNGLGTLHLIGAELDYRNPELYSHSLGLSQFQGEFDWHYDNPRQVWIVRGHEIRFHNPDIRQAEARGEVWLPGQGSGEIDLHIAFQDAVLGQIAHYVPDRRAGEHAMHWLRHGLTGGLIEQGEFVLRGPLAALPFDRGEGLVQLTGQVRDADIDYKPGWPPLSEVAASVTLRGRSLRIEGRDGRIAGNRLRQTVVELADFTSHTPLLTVNGAVHGPADNGLRFIRESPLNQQIKVGQDSLALTGNALIALDLRIPLYPAPIHTQGRITFENNSLRDQGLGLTLTGLRGALRFDDTEVVAERLPARLFNQPVAFSLRRLPGLTRATLEGAAAPDFLRKLALHLDPDFAYQGLLDKLSGAAPFTADFDFSSGPEQAVKLAIRSELAGLAVDLPAPLGKRAEQRRPLQLDTELPGKSAGTPRLRLRYGEILDAVLAYPSAQFSPLPSTPLRERGEALPERSRREQSRREPGEALPERSRREQSRREPGEALPERSRREQSRREPGEALPERSRREQSQSQSLRAGLGFGGQSARLPENGLNLSGEIAELGDWQNVLAELPASGGSLPETTLDLRIGHASALGLRDLHLRGKLDAEEWRLRADSRELTGGRLLYWPATRQAEITLEQVLLPASARFLPSREGKKMAMNWPSLNLICEDLRYGDNPLGRLELSALAIEGAWLVDYLRLENPDLDLDSQGGWEENGAGSRFWLNGSLRAPDFGKTLARFGYSGSRLIEGGPSRIDFDARWPGGPADFSLAGLGGWLTLEIGQGRLMDVEPGVGRVFGLFDLQALPHRLALDFHDVFGEGLGFEQISGRFAFAEGYAATDNLTLKSRGALIRLSGRTGLLERTYDQELIVIPHLTNTLPLAGALAGGLGVGVGVLVLQKLLQEELEQGMYYRYTVTGPWEQPKIEAVPRKEE